MKRKTLFWLIAIMSAAALIGILLILLFAQVHFTLDDEVLVKVSPTPFVAKVLANQTVPITIDTRFFTYATCSAVCNYSVDDVYNYSSTNPQESHTFNITAPEFGFGQYMTHFRTSCAVLPSSLCPATGVPRERTTLIVLEYSLNETDKKILERKDELQTALTQAKDNLDEYEYYLTLKDIWPITEIPAPTFTRAQIMTAAAYWNTQQYNLSESLIRTFEPNMLLAPLLLFTNASRDQLAHMQLDAITFLSNTSVVEFITYAQTHDTDAAQVSLAIGKLSDVLSMTTDADPPRTQVIYTGATSYLTNKTLLYLEKKAATMQRLDQLESYISLVNTSLTITPPSTNQTIQTICDRIQKIKDHNLYVVSANLTNVTILNESQVSLLSEPDMSVTFLAQVPSYCDVKQTVNINMPSIAQVMTVTFPPFEPSAPVNLLDASANCCVKDTCGKCQHQKPPIVFIHGHAFTEDNDPLVSMQAFAHIQQKLEDEGYVNAGEYSASGVPVQIPFTVRASFYYQTVYNLGSYDVTIQKSERIENYALRLREIIKDIKQQSGAPQVIVVAHSMGGLVARSYESLFGDEDVKAFITLNSPFGGVNGTVQSYCPLFGAVKECDDLSAGSAFLRKLPPVTGEWYVIAHTGCVMDGTFGDGVVTEDSSKLQGARLYTIFNGTCTDALNTDLHVKALDSDAVYNQLVSILSNMSNQTMQKSFMTAR
ncbi:MAG TPA: alpha/beta fold hydrolase [Acidobacteriota bacterium]|nr:alpha/beta fold hydrolase [Acidobacteriota bacterium]